jgi:hypothetical protein
MRDTIDMAREVKMPYDFVTGEPIYIEKLKAFEALVRADEREACAAVCDGLNFIDNGTPASTRATNRHCAAAIRARGNA